MHSVACSKTREKQSILFCEIYSIVRRTIERRAFVTRKTLINRKAKAEKNFLFQQFTPDLYAGVRAVAWFPNGNIWLLDREKKTKPPKSSYLRTANERKCRVIVPPQASLWRRLATMALCVRGSATLARHRCFRPSPTTWNLVRCCCCCCC